MAPMIAMTAGRVYAPGYEPSTFNRMLEYLAIPGISGQAALAFLVGVFGLYWLLMRSTSRMGGKRTRLLPGGGSKRVTMPYESGSASGWRLLFGDRSAASHPVDHWQPHFEDRDLPPAPRGK